MANFSKWYRADSNLCIMRLLDEMDPYFEQSSEIQELSHKIATEALNNQSKFSTARMLSIYPLNTPEGSALLSLSEALMRIPDKKTKKMLIKDKLCDKNWGTDNNFPIISKILQMSKIAASSDTVLSLMVPAMDKFINFLGKQFILGNTMDKAVKNKKGLASYDMLGEAALSMEDADRYFEAYTRAIQKAKVFSEKIQENDSVSIKLSALDPKFGYRHRNQIYDRLKNKLFELAEIAEERKIGITIDAEEAETLEITLEFLETLMKHGFTNLGIAIQAYQKRALEVVNHLEELTIQYKVPLAVRLVKGAYWDSEIKWAQESGLDFPVFTRKEATDVSYIACTVRLLQCKNIYPQFATHNAHTIATVLTLAKDKNFEIQRLHGMGSTIFDYVEKEYKVQTRIYAPVGSYKELLPYLVRRLLENGANTSFVSSFENNGELDDLLQCPAEKIKKYSSPDHDLILPSSDIYRMRKNSVGLDFSDTEIQRSTMKEIRIYHMDENPDDYMPDLSNLNAIFQKWSQTSVEYRAEILEKTATLFEENIVEIISICSREAKKSILDCVGEVREAVDFLRYYAEQARLLFNKTETDGIVGERNTITYEPKGPWLCISPWNFPLAIFVGQIAGALVCGNNVVAKPAEQTQRIAKFAEKLFYEAGLDEDVLQLAFGDGSTGAKLVKNENFVGISFTGGTDTGLAIAKSQLERNAPIGKLIAETGGVNSMIVDSTALIEQAVKDILYSSFNSAGQRCSALRVLYVQDEIYEPLMKILTGAANQLMIGLGIDLETDVGEIIDQEALDNLDDKCSTLGKKAYEYEFKASIQKNMVGHFAPRIYEGVNEVEEIFGPVLVVKRWKFDELDKIVDEINSVNTNLTFSVHTRIETRINELISKIRAGTIYVNRNQVGATVGSQPFGGFGYSGTGPKAGGENYLKSFVVEKTVSNNTTALGGNTSLIMLK